MRVRLVVAASSVFLMAAAPTEVVVVRDYAAVAKCRPLGEIRAASRLGGALANMAYNRTVEQFKQRAKSLGATHAQIVDSASGFAGSRMMGTAYDCGSDPAEAQPKP